MRARGPVLTPWLSWRCPSSQPRYDEHLQELAARQREERKVRDDHVMSTSCSGLEYLRSSTKTHPAFQTDSLRGTGSSASCCFGIIRSVTRHSLWRFSSVSSPVTGGPVLVTSEGLRQRNVYASLLCWAAVQTLWTFLRWCFLGFFTWFWRRLKPVPGSCLCGWIYHITTFKTKKKKEM